MKLIGTSILLSSILILGCGSNNDPLSDDPPQSDTTGGEPDTPEDESLEEEGETPDLITDAIARPLAIDSMELLDIMEFSLLWLTPWLESLPGGANECEQGGSVSVEIQNSNRVHTINGCEPLADSGLLLQGAVALNRINESAEMQELQLQDFSVQTGSRTVTISGVIELQRSGSAIVGFSEQLSVNDSQGDSEFDSLRIEFNSVDADASSQTVALQSTVDMSRFGLRLRATTQQNLMGIRVACPSSGQISLLADDDSGLDIMGGDGENLLVRTDGATDTLACSEIAQILTSIDNDDPTFDPPPAPRISKENR